MAIRIRAQVFWMILISAVAAVGCLDPDDDAGHETRYYLGNVYDGLSNERLTDYEIFLEYFGRRYEGTVNANGGFELDGVPQNHDYSVFINAEGYRSFISRNTQYREDDENLNPRSFHYEAFLFPAEAQTDDVVFRVQLGDSPSIPSGSLLLSATNSSSLLRQPGSIPGQVWQNSEDLLARNVMVEFEDGEATIEGGELVVGVTYDVTVLNVPGYQVVPGTTFQAGIDTDRTIVLSRLAPQTLAVTYVSTDAGEPTPDGSLYIVFNDDIEMDPLGSENFYREALDDAFGIASDNLDDDDDFNTLRSDEDEDIQERGTTFSIDGNVLQFTWDPEIGLETADPQDVIRSVTYGGLDQMFIRPVGGIAIDVTSVGTLLGQSSLTVVVQP